MGRWRAALAALALITTAGALACMWDYDTLAEEATGKRLSDVEIIVGRFERNSPLYYEMRLERVAKQLKSEPGNLSLYDDAAVASERLGKSDDALKWMEKKRAQMNPLGESASQSEKDAWYRYHANAGTFWAHKWAASHERKKEWLQNAQTHIKKAIEINPDAHFGREIYQLHAIEWALAGGKNAEGKDVNFANYLSSIVAYDDQESLRQVEGLGGLIRLGSAWKSPDIMFAFGESLSPHTNSVGSNESLRYLAWLRVRELREENISGLFKNADHIQMTRSGEPLALPDSAHDAIEDQYEKLRQNADAWHENRTRFMLSKLEQGKHPDTDADFWEGYKEVPRFEFPDPVKRQDIGANINRLLMIGGGVLAGLVVTVAGVVFWRRRVMAAA